MRPKSTAWRTLFCMTALLLPVSGFTERGYAAAGERGAGAHPVAMEEAGAGSVPSGKYNCYAYGVARPMPWEPGYGGAFEVPASTVQYLMNLTIQDDGNYQYLDRGTGTYRHNAQTREISWVSGPFAGKGFKSALEVGAGGRAVIFLEMNGTRAYCVGPQVPGATPRQAPAPTPAAPSAAGERASLVAVSAFSDAGYTDLVVGRDGTVHAVWQDLPDTPLRRQIFYSASRDGAQWSRAVNLSDAEDSRPVTLVRTVVDGRGRVYAFWKLWGTNAMAGDALVPANTRGSQRGSLRYRVLEGGRWTPVVEVGRDDKVYSWFPTVDAAGRVHLIWSENPDPALNNFSLISEVNTIRHAQLDGATLDASRVLLSEPNTGFWGLSGYIDANGKPRLIGVRQSGADRGTQQYFLWDGSTQSALASVDKLAGTEERGGAQVVRDARGTGHMVFYSPSDNAVAAVSLTASPQRVTVFPTPAGGQITGFQASNGAGGEIVVTVQAKSGPLGADVFAVRTTGGGWTQPVNVTDNASRGRQAGTTDVTGRSVGHVTTYSGRYAAGAVDATGGIHLLMSNNEITVTENTGGIAGRGAAGSTAKVYFTRLGGAALRAGAPPPTTTVPAGRVASAPAERRPPTTSAPRVPDASSGAPAAVGGLPVGSYACSYHAEYVGDLQTGTSVTILQGGQYRTPDGRLGAYVYDAASGAVRWTSGPFADGSFTAQLLRREDGRLAIRVTPAGSNNPRDIHTCVPN